MSKVFPKISQIYPHINVSGPCATALTVRTEGPNVTQVENENEEIQ